MSQNTTLTYQITGTGLYDELVVRYKGRIIACNMNVWCLRNGPEEQNRMTGWVGFNTWTYAGIEADSLPHGISVKDVLEVYLVARDELLDLGLTVPA